MKDIEVKEVIITTLTRAGKGDTSEDPVRRIIQIWTMDGELICEQDTLKK